MNLPWVRNALQRRLALLLLAIVMGVLSLWPRAYLARADLIPDESGGGLSSLLSAAGGGGNGGGGGLLAVGAMLGNHQSIEADLTIARSQAVIEDVYRRLDPAQRRRLGPPERALGRLRQDVDIQSIRGGILQVSIKARDPVVAKALAEAFVAGIRGRLTLLNLDQARQRRAVANNRIAQATADLAAAQSALDTFRAGNHLAAGPREAQASPQASVDPTGLAAKSKISEYENLVAAEKHAAATFDVYKTYLDAIAVQEQSATATLDVIEPPYLDPARQYNASFVAGFLLVLIVGVAAEFYIIRPPPGRTQG